ncbi:sex peptide receptor-related protein 2-like [Biomphalaria glabrata]|uniref:Sex peptide receptor-related protein 2-like n=1 Tax=Biomphalaria glabrata TaxID=6526 RepID=A0A9W3BHE6_BIOGL|nr:sex peptide receptor-related protein 2-like [Biomphalaria glabrata]
MSQQIEQKTLGTPNSDVFFPELYFFLYLNVPLSLCGIIANCINIIVFSKQGLNTSVNLNLFSLAVADLGSLSSLFLESLSFKPALERAGIAYLTTELFYASSVTLRFLFARIAWWITTFISFERCLCVTLPLHIKQVLTTKRTILAHAVITASIITAVSPFLVARPLGSKLIPSINTTLIGLFYTENGPYIERIAFCFNAILQFTSYILNIIFTAVIILQLNLNSRWRQNLSSLKDRSKRDKKLAKMVGCICSIFIVCAMPSCVNFMMSVLQVSGFSGWDRSFLTFREIIMTLEAINSTINIIVYYNMSSNYKEAFFSIFCLKDKPSST